MKKFVLFILAVMLSIPALPQEKSNVSTDKNVVKVNMLSLAVATGSVFYERKLSDALSGQLGVAYLGFKSSGSKFSGLILTPEVRFYPKKNAIDGVYLAPYLRYQKFSLSNDASSSEGSMNSFGGGVCLGRQWIWDSGFTMDLFFGGHYGSANLKVETGSETDLDVDLFDGFKVRMGLALGFSF